jgi:hypothetical protein
MKIQGAGNERTGSHRAGTAVMCSASTGARPLCWRAARAARSTTLTGKAYLDCVAGHRRQRAGLQRCGHGAGDERRGGERRCCTSAISTTLPLMPSWRNSCANLLCRQGALLQQRRRGQRGRVQVCSPLWRAQGGDDKVEILAFENAFHGRTYGRLAATPRPKYQDPFKPLLPGVRFARFNDLASARGANGRQCLRHHCRADAGRRRHPPATRNS